MQSSTQRTLTRFSEKGRPLTTASCARRTLAAATSFMASVIFCVFFTLPMRELSSFRPAFCTCSKPPQSSPPKVSCVCREAERERERERD